MRIQCKPGFVPPNMFDTLLQIRLCGHKHVIYGLAWEESYSVLHADSPMHPRQFVVALLIAMLYAKWEEEGCYQLGMNVWLQSAPGDHRHGLGIDKGGSGCADCQTRNDTHSYNVSCYSRQRSWFISKCLHGPHYRALEGMGAL